MPLLQTDNLRLEDQGNGVAVLWLDVAGRQVNVLGRQAMDDLEKAVDHLAGLPAIRSLILRSAKPSGFVGGADLQEFARIQTAGEAQAISEHGQRLFGKLAELPQISCAVISGPCLGGGLELALACDYRLVVDQPKTQLGLPEVELGLLPGWGGTQRLPRVVGLEQALRMILGARRLHAGEALKAGLADAMAEHEEEVPAALATLVERSLREGKRQRRGMPKRTWRQRLVESNPVGRWLVVRGTRRMLKAKVPDDMPAPWEALEAVRVGFLQGMDAGLTYEREAAGRLAVSPACRNLIQLFFMREKARKLPAELKADLVRPIKKVGIVGAGTMGAGIAQLAAIRGCEVAIQEVSTDALGAASIKIADLFRKAAENRVISSLQLMDGLGRIRGTTNWTGFGEIDLAIEAVVEDLDAKRAVFADLEKRTRPGTLLATNTSSLLVAKLQEGRENPRRIGGLHFFNPVHKMPLVEVVRGPQTDESTLASLTQWAIDLGKVPVVVQDSPGFVVNRVLMPYLNEALGFWHQVERVDRLLRQFGMPMGPFELLDQIGIEVAASIEAAKGAGDLLQRMRAKGWLGVQCGIGFYVYSGGRKRPNKHLQVGLYPDIKLRLPTWSDDIRDRLVWISVNEAARVIGEGLVPEAEQVDLGLVMGAGWAPHRGGPLRYTDAKGLAEVVKAMAKLGLEPCPELRRRAETGERFYPASYLKA